MIYAQSFRCYLSIFDFRIEVTYRPACGNFLWSLVAFNSVWIKQSRLNNAFVILASTSMSLDHEDLNLNQIQTNQFARINVLDFDIVETQNQTR